MCGIFGYTGNEEIPGLLDKMGECLSHRGPDDTGHYVNNADQIHFGLQRLSIIDLASGHQPISNENDTIWIVCNGEIYNYLELRDELIKKGHHFRTHSDTEVLVHLYEDVGLDFLENVNGMFGLALYDSSSKRFILARDRLGIKPVYYAWNGKQLAFASEIKPILLCPWVAHDPDWQAISTYLHMLYIPSPESPFREVKKLGAGTMAMIENGSIIFRDYWDLMPFLCDPMQESTSFEDASEHLRFLLKDSCRLQLRSDVPVGAFLSGGIDSSAVVSIVNSSASMNMDTFTIYWENASEKMDERKFATNVATMYGCNHHEVKISFDDFDRLLPLLVWHIEEPNADGAYVPTYVISKFAREKAKVILTGAGGDELFAGYGWYSPPSLKRSMISLLCGQQLSGYYKRAFNFPWRLIFPMYESSARSNFVDRYSSLFVAPDKLNAEMAFDLKVYLQDNIFLLTDKMSMATAVEARVPLLDHRIVEYIIGLPSSYKINSHDNKVLFKHAVSEYLPESVLRRPKDGFGAPITSWMQGGYFKNICLELLRSGELVRTGIIHKRAITRLCQLMHIRKSWVWALWILLNLELWFRLIYIESPRPDGIGLSDLR
jgi:asparagine synthase (glutamine-hydrolysing)